MCHPKIQSRLSVLSTTGMVQICTGCRLCRAVVEAASRFGRFFAGQMTAAGRVPPAKARARRPPPPASAAPAQGQACRIRARRERRAPALRAGARDRRRRGGPVRGDHGAQPPAGCSYMLRGPCQQHRGGCSACSRAAPRRSPRTASRLELFVHAPAQPSAGLADAQHGRNCARVRHARRRRGAGVIPSVVMTRLLELKRRPSVPRQAGVCWGVADALEWGTRRPGASVLSF